MERIGRTYYVLIDWVGGPVGKIFGSRSVRPIRSDCRAHAEQLLKSFYNKKKCHLFHVEQGTYNSSKNMTHFFIFFQLQFMLERQQKVDIKLSKICHSHQKLSEWQRSLHASLKLFTNLLHLKTRENVGFVSSYLSTSNINDTEKVPGVADFVALLV